ncbi:MAG: hypothetical protein IJZ85_13765 [Lachnospiraceae bacterium]|nr:hypothetical protein [Lachnospiraceae bacterium]
MTNYDDNLLQLQQKVAQKKQLEAKLKELNNQRRIFDQKVLEFKAELSSEQEDVDKLEGRSLANYFFRIVGKMDEMLDAEYQQVAAAKVKLEAAERQLAAVDSRIWELQAQIREFHGCEQAYSAALEKKRTEVKRAGTPAGEEILKLEEKIAFLESQKVEIKEALAAGHSAQGVADSVLKELDEANSWNTFDMIGGGGVITHMAKHSHLDDAQDMIEYLQGKLCTFKSELADINVHANMQVNIEGFLRFADYFFDGLFVDWTIGGQIRESRDSVYGVRCQIRTAIDKLYNLEKEADREIGALRAKIEALLVEA